MSNRRITLYIDGHKADMDASSLVLFNYAASDLSSPAAVKNTYSQQATLPATANNDRIFGSIYRADFRVRLNGNDAFNPLVRTPFALYDETGAILESGYLKLNNTKNKDGVRSYVVTLYGGLGSFFYTLAYDDEGEAMTLGALPLLGDDPAQKIDFRITAETVDNAWRRLANPTAANAEDRQFDAVNFAPAYNGLPAGEFDASKGVGYPGSVGGESSAKDDDGTHYKSYGDDSDALYDFGEDFTEWDMKDLRSYMQRPVVSVKALMDGIVRYAAAKGFSVNLDPVWFSDTNPYYRRAWMTLPLLAGRAVPNKGAQNITVGGYENSKNVAGGAYSFVNVDLAPTISVTNTNVTVKCKPVPVIWPVFPQGTLPTRVWMNIQADKRNKQATSVGMVMFVQVQLLDTAGKVVGASPIKICLGISVSGEAASNLTAEQLVAQAALRGCLKGPYTVDSKLYMASSDIAYLPMVGGLMRQCNASEAIGEVEVTAYNAVSARVCFEPRSLYYNGKGTISVTKDRLYCSPDFSYGGIDPLPIYPITEWGGHIMNATLEYAAVSDEYRSGAQVTQEALFADTMSPMELLLSYTKTFGLHYLYDTARKQVDIVTRNTFYGGRPTIDLQERIDRSQEITTEPIPMTSKWLEFAPANTEGEFADYYKAKYGREYGIQKVNTGFDFDANTSQALDNAKFNAAPEVLERSKYYLYFENRKYTRVPAPTIDAKTTYKLFRKDENGELQSLELDYPNMTLASVGFEGFRYFNANKGYDGVPKLQCHGEDNSGTDGAGILLIHRGLASSDPATTGDDVAKRAYNGFIITDDSAAMYDLAGKPCWKLSDSFPSRLATYMPSFGRFDMQGTTITRSQELGTPAEIDNPVIAVGRYTSVYERCWAAYIADRYNANTRTCTAYVDLRGLQPGPEMLRDFYYFDGAIWVLNKIANYSLSTPGTTQCEFVKVQDQAAYAAGQVYTRTITRYGAWAYYGPRRIRLVTFYVEEVYPDGTTDGGYISNEYVEEDMAQVSVEWDGTTYWNGSCGTNYYYVDYRKVRDKYTWSDGEVRYSDYRNGESRSRRIDGQCGWVRDWRATGDWYRSGGTCNAAGKNGAYDCDGTYSVTYWNEGQDQSYCYPDMSGSTQTRTIWRVGPEATREQVEGQCGYTPKNYQLDSVMHSWSPGVYNHDTYESVRETDGTLHITTGRHYTDRTLAVTFALYDISLADGTGNSSPIAPGSLTFTLTPDVGFNCVASAMQEGKTAQMTFRASDTTMVAQYIGTITITHTTGARIVVDVNISFSGRLAINTIEATADDSADTNAEVEKAEAEPSTKKVAGIPADEESDATAEALEDTAEPQEEAEATTESPAAEPTSES